MEPVHIEGTGGWIDYDGVHLKIVRSGIWNTLTGMSGHRELPIAQVSAVRFRKAIRGHGGGFIQFLRVDDPLAEMQKKMFGVYGRKDDIAAASLDPFALTFNFRQEPAFETFKERVEQDAGVASSPLEVPTELIEIPDEPEAVIDYVAKKPKRSGWVRPTENDSAALYAQSAPQPTQPTPEEPAVDPIDAIRRLAELRDAGIVTTEDFETKKAELLSRL
ncbi:MAG: SHOCT domain-containing protein [Propionibacteriaceae bacterium]|jgi:hypothetical protein|nr:SHOCT domain-containing protein [Propionibacteriaceae bacterium]